MPPAKRVKLRRIEGIVLVINPEKACLNPFLNWAGISGMARLIVALLFRFWNDGIGDCLLGSLLDSIMVEILND